MTPQPRGIVCSPDRRDAGGPGTGNAERVEAVLGRPESGKPATGAPDRLPHERDQKLEEQRSEPRSNVQQAARDIESGQLDTDLHNTPGVERVVRERHAANREDTDRRVANRSADDLAHKRGQTGKPSRSHDDSQG
ncbi:hypothetical protein [Ralstonia mannitolilytica]|uniref:hypothetical protein n=1 Tax=Ralstonia mannitolilytica TaxID=105219 RepID=UPI0028F4FB14|nr:hypothetical protein [Ralstonia mannitolilytica]CAJ0736338.1 hypothetical protein R76696_01215 [Ralstonia mannitolilytica]